MPENREEKSVQSPAEIFGVIPARITESNNAANAMDSWIFWKNLWRSLWTYFCGNFEGIPRTVPEQISSGL